MGKYQANYNTETQQYSEEGQAMTKLDEIRARLTGSGDPNSLPYEVNISYADVAWLLLVVEVAEKLAETVRKARLMHAPFCAQVLFSTYSTCTCGVDDICKVLAEWEATLNERAMPIWMRSSLNDASMR